MAQYRLYVVGPDGCYRRTALLEFATDAEAARAAVAQAGGRPMELWSGRRLVAMRAPKPADLSPVR